MSIEIISSGLQTTIQDLGRSGFGHMGVPESGAADKFSLKLGNFLLGKNVASPAIECTLTGPSLKFLKPFKVAITGANMKPKVNNENLKINKIFTVGTNDILSLGNCSTGCRSYIALSDDLVCETFMKSASTYLPAKLGGIEGAPLKTGLIINTSKVNLDDNQFKEVDFSEIKTHTNKWELRVFEGPEFSFLSSKSKKQIFSSSYEVSNDSNRMGNRLEGDRLGLISNNNIKSSPVSTGTVQCPANGLPIILGCDSHTLGGYPRVLQIAAIDFPLIGQLRPRDKVVFKRISLEDAIRELKKQSSLFPFLA